MRDESLAQICQQYNIAILYTFGARAKEADAFMRGQIEQLAPGAADLDLGILPTDRQRMTIREKIDLTSNLKDFFNVGRVDMVVLPEADPFLAANISSEAKGSMPATRPQPI